MQESLFTVAKLEDFVPADHPLRPLRELVNEALQRLNGLFNVIYAQAWASHKSFVPKDGSDDGKPPQGGRRNAQADWKGKPRSNTTHASITDLDARLYKKSDNTPAVISYLGHILIENRSGLMVGAVVSHADGTTERAQALRLLERTPGRRPKTVGADKAYDTRDFVADCRARNITSHVARHVRRWGGSAIDGRTTRHGGYEVSQVIRKRIEEHFGWGKTVGRVRQTVYRGLRRVDQHFKLTMVASKLTRMARILFAEPQGALP